MSARGRSIVAAVLLLAVLVAGQAVADASVPEGRSGTGTSLGRTGFAYLTGLRTGVAAMLWNRIEPQFHGYYEKRSLAELGFILPSVEAIVRLDPQFVQAYYIAPAVVIKNGRVREGLELARQGVLDNPDSGLLLSSYADLLSAYGDKREAARVADRARRAKYADAIEQHDSYALLVGVYLKAGRAADADHMKGIVARLNGIIRASGWRPEED